MGIAPKKGGAQKKKVEPKAVATKAKESTFSDEEDNKKKGKKKGKDKAPA